jgi:hypothetical protein
MEDIKEIETETTNAADTIVEISETKSTQPHNGHVDISETKSDQPHNGKEIDRIIVSQYIEDDPYVVTYSREDNSILGWSVNIEETGQQQPDVYFKLDKGYRIKLFVLYKKILVFSYNNGYSSGKYLF